MDDNNGEVMLRILSIDAWRDGPGWTWNNWHHVGDISKADFEALSDDANGAPLQAHKANRKILAMFRERGYLRSTSGGKCSVDDDGHNVVVQARGTGEPLFAIEYGPAY